jgi:hypothetical protein
MPDDDILLDEIIIRFAARPGRPDAESLAARRVLLRGGFTPKLRAAVRDLVRRYTELRRLKLTVSR